MKKISLTNASILIVMLIISNLFFLIVTGCSFDNGSTAPGENIQAPSNVYATLVGNTIRVTWPPVKKADGYEVYRRLGNGLFDKLTVTGNSSFVDNNFPNDKFIYYAVKSVKIVEVSEMSNSSPAVTVNVQNVRASKYTLSGSIVISWEAVYDPELQIYKVYRFDTIAENAVPVKTYETSSVTQEDTGIDFNKPYFYKVTWKKNGIEYGVDGSLEFGVCSLRTDEGEKPDNKNDDYFNLLNDDLSTPVAEWASDPFLYSYFENLTLVGYDMDWYKYRGPSDTGVVVKITLPKNTPYKTMNEKLVFQFRYDDTVYEENILIGEGEKIFNFDFPEHAPVEDLDLYFVVYPVISSGVTVIGDYSLEISNGI